MSMGTETTVNANMILKSTETDLQEEAVDECMFSSLETEAAEETGYDGQAPSSVVDVKKETKLGSKYIEFSMTKQLEGEGTYDDQVLSGREEPIEQWDEDIYFSEIRHGVPFPLKGLEAHFAKAFPLLQKRQRALSVWNGRIEELWAWEAIFKRCPDRVNAKHGSSSPQRWHPHIYSAQAGGISKVDFSLTTGTYQASVVTKLDALQMGDNINVDRIWELEAAAADQKLRKVKMSIDGSSEPLWLWAYPRAARVRLKKTLADYFLQGDVRGPNNRAIRGDKYKFGQFLFVEANYLPRITWSGSSLSLQSAWSFNSQTNKRSDARTAVKGVAHVILGEDGLCKAAPENLQWDFERKDYRRKEGIGTYRLLGFGRGSEFYDNRANPTECYSTGSMVVVEHAQAA